MQDSTPLLVNRVAQRLNAGQVAISMSVRIVDSIEVAQVAFASGYDSLYVDMQHGAMSLRTTGQICIAAIALGVTPFVRVPNSDASTIARILDAGALGIIVPNVTNAADAQRIVQAAKFPPVGGRSVTAGVPQFHYRNPPLAEARKLLNDQTTVITMIEGPEGLDNVEEIAAVDGVDILFIGTNDLCADMGIHGQFEHPRVHAAYERTIAAARKHGKHVGIGGLAGRPDLIRKYVEMGGSYVSAGGDLHYLLAAAKERCEAIRKAVG